MKKLILALLMLHQVTGYTENCFNLGLKPKKQITADDYLEIQEKMNFKQKDIIAEIEKLYPQDAGYTTIGDFIGRCTKGVRQILIDPEKGSLPVTKLEKIGTGGDRCIVTCIPFNGKYPELATAKVKALESVGFNGYYLYIMGGFPNPTGIEIKYIGVPYSFKIFAMVEAHKRGFSKVLWVDSAALPLRDPTPLFYWLEENEAFLNGWPTPNDSWRFIFPQTRQILSDATGTDVLNSNYINTIVFGLNMDTILAKSLVNSYYLLADMGTPFLSCFPEEFVLTAIIGQSNFRKWKLQPFSYYLLRGSLDPSIKDSPESIELRRSEGYFFYHQQH